MVCVSSRRNARVLLGQRLCVRSLEGSGARRGKDVAIVARMHRAASVLADGRMLVAGG